MTNTQMHTPIDTPVHALSHAELHPAGATLDAASGGPDLYREIHKGVRFALFHATIHAGRVDVADTDDIEALLERCTDLIELLELHHHHEDVFLQPLIARHAPELAIAVDAQHADVEAGMVAMRRLGERLATGAGSDRPTTAHELYLHLTSFTATYLDHQLVEETEVMPALHVAVPAHELDELHTSLRQSIAPEVLADTIGIMLPAMNVEERVDMLAGMSMAPAPVWAILRRAAEAALGHDDFATVATRIGLN